MNKNSKCITHIATLRNPQKFRNLPLTYKVCNGIGPSYLKELIIPHYSSRSLNCQQLGLHVLLTIYKTSMGG